MPQLITLATAKLLSDSDSNLWEAEGLQYEYYYCPDGGYGEKLLEPDYALDSRIERHGWPIYPAFSQSDVQTYLRNAHNIIVESNYVEDYENPKFRFVVNDFHHDERHLIEQMDHLGQSYEEALEKGLNEGIKLIKSQ